MARGSRAVHGNKFEGDGVSIYGRRHHRQSTRRGPRLAYTIKVGPSESGAGPAGALGAGILPEWAISRGRKSGPATLMYYRFRLRFLFVNHTTFIT